MEGANASLLALGTAGAALTLGWAVIHTIRAGFDYMSSRGNPRNRAQAHESMRDVGIGVALVLGAATIGGLLVATLVF